MSGAYLIWSKGHRAWWRPASAGYTIHAEAAGRYSHEQALSICANARDGWRPGSPPPEIPVAEADVLVCEARYHQMTGNLGTASLAGDELEIRGKE